MPRIVKAGPVRRAEILSHAVGLFLRKGYDATTIEDILESVGLSKGAFYHHYESKEALLEAFTAVIVASIAEHAARLLGEDCSECERLNRLLKIGQSIQYEPEPAPVSAFTGLFRAENAALYQRLMDVGATTMTPILLAIVNAGVARGEFDVPDGPLAVESILQLSVTRFGTIVEALRLSREGDLDGGERILERRLVAECKLIERILGLGPNSIALAPAGHVRAVLEALSPKATRRRAGTSRARS